MKIWLILLGVAIGLGIALRRVLRRQSPLSDELYSKQVAVAHVQSGVAWVRGDGTFGMVNQAFADTFGITPGEFNGREWYKAFGAGDHARIRESYGQMMLQGMTSFEATARRTDGSLAWLNVRLVAVHDGHMRFVGHQCLIQDKTRERDLEQQVRDLEERLKGNQAAGLPPAATPAMPPDPSIPTGAESLSAMRRAAARTMVSALNTARKSPMPQPELPPAGTR